MANYKYASLVENLSTKTLKQATNMIHTRIRKDLESGAIVYKYSDYPYSDIPKYQRLVTKHQKIIDDCSAWMENAFHAFSCEVWDSIIDQPIETEDGQKHQTIDSWGSHNMKQCAYW